MPVVNVDDLVRLQRRPDDIRNASYPSIPLPSSSLLRPPSLTAIPDLHSRPRRMYFLLV